MKKQSTGSEKSEEAGEGRWGFSETLPEKEMRTWVQVGETVVGHEKTLVLWGGGYIVYWGSEWLFLVWFQSVEL